ncbi:TRAP transporter large permease [Pararhodobacter sp.]|uniref:TRAP transporter large permease n=1 Tax=Pararhodobacter sp. TaxID=2127056 RepID=UPI002FDE1A2D
MTAVIFLVLLLGAVPISIVLIMTSAWYVRASGNDVLFTSFAQQLFSGIESYGLLAIPLFMLTGELMNEGGATRRLVHAARVFVGGFRGGLAYINLLANMFMAAIIGSAVSQIAVMSRAMVPVMEAEGYRKDFATATTAAGGLLAPIIPPSMLLVIYGVLAQLPISDLFIAAIIPGLMLTGSFFVVVALIGLKQQFPKGEWMSAGAAGKALLAAVPAAMIPAVIVGSILFGIATPTESAAIASVIALMIGALIYRDLNWSRFLSMFLRVAASSSMVIFLIAAANVFGWVVIYEALPQRLTAMLVELTQNPLVFLLIVMGVLFLVGMVIDGIAALILVVPLLLPVAVGVYGIHPVQFGLVISLNLVLGLLTPPVGAGLYVAAAMTGARPTAIFMQLLPFLAVSLIVLLLLCLFPWLTLALI